MPNKQIRASVKMELRTCHQNPFFKLLNESDRLAIQTVLTNPKLNWLETNFTISQLNYLLAHSALDGEIKQQLYLQLIQIGPLPLIKELANHLNFSIRDADNRNAMLLACKRGSVELVNFFVYQCYGLLQVTSNHGLDPVITAALYGHMDLMITLLKPISNGGFGCPLNPEHLNQNPNNTNLLVAYQRSANMADHNASVMLYNIFTGVTERYIFTRKLGSGTYGDVSEFSCHQKRIAVKSKIIPATEDTVPLTRKRNNSQWEFRFLCKAYPHEQPYALQHIYDDLNGHYSYRIIMPFVEGIPLHRAMEACGNPPELAQLFFAVTKELERIHALGICHGDLRPANIMVRLVNNAWVVHIIDFAFAYKMTKHPVHFGVDDMVPPEKGHREVSAHPSQDIYSLAKTFACVIEQWACTSLYRRDVNYLLIDHIIKVCCQAEPHRRYTLSLCKKGLEYAANGKAYLIKDLNAESIHLLHLADESDASYDGYSSDENNSPCRPPLPFSTDSPKLSDMNMIRERGIRLRPAKKPEAEVAKKTMRH